MRIVKCAVCGQVIEPKAPIMHFGVFDAVKRIDHSSSDILVYKPLFGGEEAHIIDLCEPCYNGIFREGRTLTDMACTLVTEV